MAFHSILCWPNIITHPAGGMQAKKAEKDLYAHLCPNNGELQKYENGKKAKQLGNSELNSEQN